jgi:hypothetical protein
MGRSEGIVTLAKNRPFSVDFAPTSRAPNGFVRATAGRLRMAQHGQTQAVSNNPPAKPGAFEM